MRLKVDSEIRVVSLSGYDGGLRGTGIRRDRRDTVTNPTVIVEVLSASTALTDHNAKLDEYIQIESVQNYLLISQHEAKVEIYTRQSDGQWLYSQAKGLDARVKLASIDCTVSLSKVYEKVEFEQHGDA